MKLKTSELIGPALDWAVELAILMERLSNNAQAASIASRNRRVSEVGYSTNWEQGGPLIEREWLQLTPWPNEADEELRWHCVQHDSPVQCHAFGPTALVAACRCYVSSKLGDEVELPEDLK